MKIFDFLFLARPILLVPVWGFSALGYVHAKTIRGESALPLVSEGALTDFIPMLYFSLSVASVYVFNQIADFTVDENNGGFPLLVRSGINKKHAWAAAFFYGTLSLFLSYLYSIPLSALAGLAIVVGYFYCFPPCYFTGRPFLDFLSNAFGYGIVAFGAGWHIAGEVLFSMSFANSAFPYVLLMCAGSISSTIPDMPGDQMEGKITTAVLLGGLKAHVLAGLIICAAVLVSIMLKNWIALTGAFAALPFYIAYLISKKKRTQEMSYKIGGGLLMMIAAYAYPVLLIPSLAVLISTWLYFRIRHGVLYPSLNPAGHVSKNS